MEPYYQHAGITIYHGDCRDILPQLARFDLTLTDPPYGIGESYASFSDTRERVRSLVSEFMPLILQSSSRILLTPGNRNGWFYPEPEWTLAWIFPAGAGANPWGFTCWQPILAYGKDPYLAHGLGGRPDIFIHTETSERNGHPCPKPIGLWKKLLLRGSVLETDLVFDPFCGSGTTLRAAKDLGRKAVGIDIEEQYCEIAARRLSQEVLHFETTTEQQSA